MAGIKLRTFRIDFTTRNTGDQVHKKDVQAVNWRTAQRDFIADMADRPGVEVRGVWKLEAIGRTTVTRTTTVTPA